MINKTVKTATKTVSSKMILHVCHATSILYADFLREIFKYQLNYTSLERTARDDDWVNLVKSYTRMEVDGNRPTGRPQKTWMK
jgi:hypothetical protein